VGGGRGGGGGGGGDIIREQIETETEENDSPCFSFPDKSISPTCFILPS